MASGHLDLPFPLLSLLWKKCCHGFSLCLVAFVHSKITETHFMQMEFLSKKKKRTNFFSLKTNYYVLGTKKYLLYPPKSAMPALNLTSLKREEKEREGEKEKPPHLEKYIQTKNNLQKKNPKNNC